VAISLGICACRQGKRVRFYTAAGLINEMVEAQAESRLSKLQAQLMKQDLVILDEVGFIPFSQSGAHLLFQFCSAKHERGIPHLQSVRDLTSRTLQMLRGLHQKIVREGGSIEHFNIEDEAGNGHKEIEQFREDNKENLEFDPSTLVRQLFSVGKVSVERLVADSKVTNDGLAVDLFLEIIYVAAGVSSAIMGYKTHLQIKDATSVLRENYFQTLSQIETALFRAIRQSFDIELLLHNVDLESLSYRLKGGEFRVDIRPEIQQQAFDAGAYTLNQLLQAGGFDQVDDPIFNAPGLKLSQKAAVQYAIDKGLIKDDEFAELLRGPAPPPPVAPGEEQPEPGKTNGSEERAAPPPLPRD